MRKVTHDDIQAEFARLRQLRDRLTRALAESRLLRDRILRSPHRDDFVPLRLVLHRFGTR